MAKKSKKLKPVLEVKKEETPVLKTETEPSYDESIAQRSKVEDQISGRKVYESADQERIAQEQLAKKVESE